MLHNAMESLAALAHPDDQLLLQQLASSSGDDCYPMLFKALFNVQLPSERASNYWKLGLSRQQRFTPDTHRLRTALFDLLLEAGELEDPRVINGKELADLQRNAVTDGLTKLFNQSHFKQTLSETIIDHKKRPGSVFSLLLFDLDHFKQYNDRCGHLRGDQVLAEAGKLISAIVPEQATAARYGGEEFAVILPGIGLPQAVLLAERIRLAIAQTPFEGEERLDRGNLTISGGVATYPASGTSAVALIAHADAKLYDAKLTRNSISPRPSDSRGIIRHAFRSIVEIRKQLTGPFLTALSNDISYTGLLLKSSLAAEVGSPLELRFPCPFWPSDHTTVGLVRHVRQNDPNGGVLIGVEFEQPQVEFIEQVLPAEIYQAPS